MRKTLWILLLFVLICTGCKGQSFSNHVHTIIENNRNTVIGVSYPTTNIRKLDKLVKGYVDKNIQSFKDEYTDITSLNGKSELNIDYRYHLMNKKYINIILNTFINSPSLAHPIHEVKTYVYDIKENKILRLKDLFNEKELEKLISLTETKLIEKYKDCIGIDELHQLMEYFDEYSLFQFTDHQLLLYFNPYEISPGYCDILEINIPLSQIDFPIASLEMEQITPTIVTKERNNAIDPEKPVVALTFDDGPSKYTNDILEILKSYDASATFFVIGNKAEIYTETLQKMVRYGQEIGNHSYNHKWLTKLTDDDFFLQLNKTQEIVKKITGFTPTLMRPTYGAVNQKLREKCQLKVVMWTVDTRDWEISNPKKIAEKAIKEIHDGDIVLMHDVRKRTVDALKLMIEALKEQGYQFVTVSELEEVELIKNKLKENNQ